MLLSKSKKQSETIKKYTTPSVKDILQECQDSFLKWMIFTKVISTKKPVAHISLSEKLTKAAIKKTKRGSLIKKQYQFVRKIDEGGYKKNQEGFFNQGNNKVLVKDYKHKSEKTIVVSDNIQDIVSTFYYLRNHPTIDKLKVGESVAVDMFFDDETTKFKLKFLGYEDIDTKFGTVPTMIFRPLVQSGRVFKEEESLTVWISNDDNKLPVRIKASLAVGSIKADLDAFKGLKYSFKVKVKP